MRARERLSPPRRDRRLSIDRHSKTAADQDAGAIAVIAAESTVTVLAGGRTGQAHGSACRHDRRSWGEAAMMAGPAAGLAGIRPRPRVLGSTDGAEASKLGIAATVAGTMAGSFPGGEIGASLDQADRLYAARLRQAASETRPSGVPSRWHNPNTGNAGAITPTRTYRSPGGIYRRE